MGVVVIHLPTGLLKTRYRDVNPVPTSPLTDHLATVPSGLVNHFHFLYLIILHTLSTSGVLMIGCN